MIDSSPYIFAFFKAFISTFLIEYLVFSLLNRDVRALRIAGAVLVANIFSLTIIWFLFAYTIRENLAYIFLSELFAILSESVILIGLSPISCKRCFLTAFSMNLTSFVLGGVLLS